VDVAHPFHDNHIEVVSKTLADIGAGNIPAILVLNKIDLLEQQTDAPDLEQLKGSYRHFGFHDVVFISAAEKRNMAELRAVVLESVRARHMTIYPNFVPTSAFLGDDSGD